MNIAVIGAGPIGGYAAALLAQQGHAVEIYEEHSTVGCPIQCTGLLTSDFDEFELPMDSFLVNTFSRIEVFSSHQKTTIRQKEYVVNRTKFDSFFVEMAVTSGATLFLNHAFVRKEVSKLILRDNIHKTEKAIEPDLVLAADGPLSKTAKAYGMFHPERQNYYGIQATVQGNFDPSAYQAYFGTEVCPGLFAWIVPESSTLARVGIATMNNSKFYFDNFMKERGFTALEMQAGTIPFYHHQQILKKDNCYVLGDASSYVKATTLGGLVPGLKQAEIVAECIHQGKDIEKDITPLRRKMWLHSKIQQVLNTFSDADFDRLLRYMNQPRIQKVLQQHTRDNPWPIIIKTLLLEPRFLYFGKKLIGGQKV